MDASRGYYAKRNKSNRERQLLHDLTYMWNLKTKTNKKYGTGTKTEIQINGTGQKAQR